MGSSNLDYIGHQILFFFFFSQLFSSRQFTVLCHFYTAVFIPIRYQLDPYLRLQGEKNLTMAIICSPVICDYPYNHGVIRVCRENIPLCLQLNAFSVCAGLARRLFTWGTEKNLNNIYFVKLPTSLEFVRKKITYKQNCVF